jgi:FkbM family methyltransferase
MGKPKITFGFILGHPLGSRHPIRAFVRLFIWQLQSRLSKGLVVKKFVLGTRFYAKRRLTGVTGNIYTGLHEFFDMAFLLHYLRPGDSFLDVGANVGSYTILASGVIGAKSISLEPVPSTFSLLEKNLHLNKLQDKVTALNAGAGADTGMLTFSGDEDTTNHVLASGENPEKTVMVATVAVDSLCADLAPVLVKIDVEGFETEVLRGMGKTLANASLRAIIIELNGSGKRYGFDEEAIHRLLLGHGFQPYHYDPFNRELSLLNTFGSHNTIYCRGIGAVEERLRSGRRVRIMGENI